jgi:hypothetical protein
MPTLKDACRLVDGIAVGEGRLDDLDLPVGRGHCLHRDLPGRWLAEVGGFADAVLPRRPGSAPGT